MTTKQWTKNGDKWTDVGATITSLAPGFYHVSPGGMFTPWGLISSSLRHDQVIITGITKKIIEELDKFWRSRDTYHKLGFLHKRGVMLIGEPGVGKSMTVALLVQHVVAKGGVALTSGRRVSVLDHACHTIRAIHPDMPILNVMEDIEYAYTDSSAELTSLLDGESQIDNVVHVATTNAPQHLDARLLDRPGRFDHVAWIGAPDEATRRAYLTAILPADFSTDTLNELARKSKGLLLSHMRELISATQILGRPLDATVATLMKMRKLSEDNDEIRKKLGFNELIQVDRDDDAEVTLAGKVA